MKKAVNDDQQPYRNHGSIIKVSIRGNKSIQLVKLDKVCQVILIAFCNAPFTVEEIRLPEMNYRDADKPSSQARSISLLDEMFE